MRHLEFTAEDFIGKFSFMGPSAQAEIMQAKFDEWYRENIENAVTVYLGYTSTAFIEIPCWYHRMSSITQKTAKLVDVKPIDAVKEIE